MEYVGISATIPPKNELHPATTAVTWLKQGKDLAFFVAFADIRNSVADVGTLIRSFTTCRILDTVKRGVIDCSTKGFIKVETMPHADLIHNVSQFVLFCTPGGA